MAGRPRYLWGDSLMGFITLKPRATAPEGKAGRIYYDSTYNTFKFCEDGTSFLMVDLHN